MHYVPGMGWLLGCLFVSVCVCLCGVCVYLVVYLCYKYFTFQAENEDEQVKWVQALRRCTRGVAMPGRPAMKLNGPIRDAETARSVRKSLIVSTQVSSEVKSGSSIDQLDEISHEGIAESMSTLTLRDQELRQALSRQEHGEALLDFLRTNGCCADCSSTTIRWIDCIKHCHQIRIFNFFRDRCCCC